MPSDAYRMAVAGRDLDEAMIKQIVKTLESTTASLSSQLDCIGSINETLGVIDEIEKKLIATLTKVARSNRNLWFFSLGQSIVILGLGITLAIG